MHVIIHLSKPTECTPRKTPNVNSGLWVIMMCQCRFITLNKCTTLVGHVEHGGGCACMWLGGIWDMSVPTTQFCCEPKIAPKNKVC